MRSAQPALIALTLLAAAGALLWGGPAVAAPQVTPAVDTDFHYDGRPSPELVELGRLLFFDKVLSGNLNISCATCHHPMTATGDGLPLSVGEGARGLGPVRDTGYGASAVRVRVPRNAPPLFNLGAREFLRMFLDGRVESDYEDPFVFHTPAGDELPEGLENVLAAQALFPVASDSEMAGDAGENEQADAAAAGRLAGPGGVWELIAEKLRAIPDYFPLFSAAFPGQVVNVDDIDFVLAANAIAAYETVAWRSDNSPFDRFLRGDKRALSREARQGMNLFYGAARCGSCHAGIFQTDHAFHAIAMPQVGPGKGDSQPGYHDGRDDFGRERVTGQAQDRFRFRTPPLRNVALTAPYGHAGAYDSLEAIVRHYIDPVTALQNYQAPESLLPSREDLDALDFVVQNDPVRLAGIGAANTAIPVTLTQGDVNALVAFLHALTDPSALDLRHEIPPRVPSGLPIWD